MVIKRADGKELKGRSEKFLEVSVVRIADLVPYEIAAVKPTVERYREGIKAGTSLEPIKVYRIGEKMLVVDGTNRCRAAVMEGLSTVSAKIFEPATADAVRYSDAIEENANLSFGDLPIDKDDEARVKRTVEASRERERQALADALEATDSDGDTE